MNHCQIWIGNKKSFNKDLEYPNEYMFETLQVKSSIICLKRCNIYEECAVASFNKDNTSETSGNKTLRKTKTRESTSQGEKGAETWRRDGHIGRTDC